MVRVYLRVNETHEHYVVAMCDKPLLGKTLKHGDIKFKVSKEFYGGDLVDLNTCIKHLEKATIANMVGETSTRTMGQTLIEFEFSGSLHRPRHRDRRCP